MKDAQNNGKEADPAEELENLVQDVAGYDGAYAAAKQKRETAEKALELAKAEENFEADKLRAILAAVRTKSATDAKVYDQHLRNCLGKMNTTRSDRWNEKTRRYDPEPIPGVSKWSDLAKAGASDAQIISNLKIGFGSYSGAKSGLYQLKGMQFKSILGEDDMGRKKGVTILDQKQLLAAIRRVMKIGQPKPKSPPPAKKPEQKKPAAAAAKKAPEKKAAPNVNAPAPATTARKSKVKASPTPPAEPKKSAPRPAPRDHKLQVGYAISPKEFAKGVLAASQGTIELERTADPIISKFFEDQRASGWTAIEAYWHWKDKLIDEGAAAKESKSPIDQSAQELAAGHMDDIDFREAQNAGLAAQADIFDSGTGIPDQPQHQGSSWHQWAQLVRSNPAAKDCPEWPRTQGKIFREPLVDPNDKAIRAAYLAGRKPAAAARELAAMFSKRAVKADRSRSTLNEKVSEAEEKSLKGEKVGAA